MPARVRSITSATLSGGRRPQKMRVTCRFAASITRRPLMSPSAACAQVAIAFAVSAGSEYAMKMRGRGGSLTFLAIGHAAGHPAWHPLPDRLRLDQDHQGFGQN